MPVPKELIDKIYEYESAIDTVTGQPKYTKEDIVIGLSQSENYPEIAEKIRVHLEAGVQPEEILSKIRGADIVGMQREKEQGKITQGPPWFMRGIVKPTMEYGGLATGSILGFPYGGPLGSVAFAGPGYAAGKVGYETLEKGLYGTEEPNIPQKPLEKILGATKDVAKGMEMEATGQVGGVILNKIYAPFAEYLKTPAGKELADIYAEYGIKPVPSELNPSSKTFGIFEGVLGYRPLSGDVMINRALKNMEIMNEARKELIAKGADRETIEVVGNRIRNEATEIIQKYTQAKGAKLDAMVNRFTDQLGLVGKHQAGTEFSVVIDKARQFKHSEVERKYSDWEELLPGRGNDVVPHNKTMDAIDELAIEEKASKVPNTRLLGLFKRLGRKAPEEVELPQGITEKMLERDPELASMVKEIKSPEMTWIGLKKTNSQIQDRIRTIIRAHGGHTEESRAYAKISKAIEGDMEAFARNQSPELWPAYVAAKKSSKEYHDIYTEDMLKLASSNPDKILDKIVKEGNVTLLRQIQMATGEEGLIPLRQGAFKKMLDVSSSGDKLNVQKLQTNMKKLGETLNELYTTDQIKMMETIIDKGKFFNIHKKDMKTYEFLETLAGTNNNSVKNFLIKEGNTYNINLAKKLLSSDRLKEIESLMIEDTLRMGASGTFLPYSSSKEFNKLKENLRTLLEPEKFESLNKFIAMGNGMKRAEQLAANASQTGQVLLGSQVAGSVLRYPSKAIGLLGIPYVIARIYTSETASRYFTRAIGLDPSSKQAISNFITAVRYAIPNMFEQKEMVNPKDVFGFKGEKSKIGTGNVFGIPKKQEQPQIIRE